MRLVSKDERVWDNFCYCVFSCLLKEKSPFFKLYKQRGKKKRDWNIYIGNVKF